MSNEPPSDSFTCEACGGTYTKGWTDAEAVAEADAAGFRDQSAVVCDPCYVKMMAWAKREGIDLVDTDITTERFDDSD